VVSSSFLFFGSRLLRFRDLCGFIHINVKKNCRPIIDTYKTAKIPSVTSRAVDIIHSLFIISTALDVTGGIFAVLYVSIMGLTSCYKKTVFLHLYSNMAEGEQLVCNDPARNNN